MIRIVADGLKAAQAELDRQQKQVPFATALALTRTAQIAKAEVEESMGDVFDRPTRWTLNSLRLFPAKKTKLQARVWMKDEAVKSSPATKWLNPEIEGGARQDKASERNLRQQGILPAGKYVAPGKGAKLDRHGNMTKGAITKALSGVKGFAETGFNANATGSTRSKRKGNSKRYFVLKRGSMPLGIAERSSRSRVQMVLAFVSRPSYSRRLDFYGIGDRVVRRHLADEFTKAMENALRTGR